MLLIIFFASRPHGFHDQNLKYQDPIDVDILIIGLGRSLRGRPTTQITQTTTYQRLGSGLREEKSEGEVEKGLRATTWGFAVGTNQHLNQSGLHNIIAPPPIYASQQHNTTESLFPLLLNCRHDNTLNQSKPKDAATI